MNRRSFIAAAAVVTADALAGNADAASRFHRKHAPPQYQFSDLENRNLQAYLALQEGDGFFFERKSNLLYGRCENTIIEFDAVSGKPGYEADEKTKNAGIIPSGDYVISPRDGPYAGHIAFIIHGLLEYGKTGFKHGRNLFRIHIEHKGKANKNDAIKDPATFGCIGVSAHHMDAFKTFTESMAARRTINDISVRINRAMGELFGRSNKLPALGGDKSPPTTMSAYEHALHRPDEIIPSGYMVLIVR